MSNRAFIDAVTHLDFPGVILLCINAENGLLGVNPYGSALVGMTADQLQGALWYEVFVRPPDQDNARSLIDSYVRGEWLHLKTFETVLTTVSGSTRRISWRPARRQEQPGDIFFLLGEDVTARDKAQSDLHTAEAKMDAVVETAADGIITIDESGIIQTVNKAARRLFGYSEEEMLGRNVSMLMPSPDRENHDGYLRHYIMTGIAGIIGKGRAVTALRKDGTQFPIYLAVSEVKGDARLFTGIVRDLTHENEMQKQLQEQEALATLGKMAAVVAHEVRNPLAGIAGVLQILRSRAEQGTTEYEIMGDVLERIDALVETIGDLLLYARPRELRLKPVPLNDLLNETARLLTADPYAKEVKVDMPQSGCTLMLDVDYLREALLNVYLNAAQAMSGEGEIRTELSDVEGQCVLRIADSGPGIPEEIRGKVFEPFFTTKGRGTGIGLALVKRVIERHGGRIGIECPEQGGTVVTIALPHAANPG